MTTGTYVMPQGRWQLEQGMSYDVDKTSGITQQQLTFSSTLLRYGLTRNAELRLQMDALYSHNEIENVTGLCPIIVGTKIRLHESQSALPSVGLLAQLVIPSGKREFRSDHIAPQLFALFSSSISDRFGLDYNIGLQWDGDDAAPTTFTALAASFTPTDNTSIFFEGYGYMHSHTSAQWYVNGGAALKVSPRVQFDLSGGVLLHDFGKDLFIAFGVSWLL